MSTSQETLRSLTLEIIDNYRKAAKSSVEAFRAGSSRGFNKVDSTIDKLLTSYEGSIGKAVKNTLDVTKKQADVATEFADTTVDLVGSTVKSALVSTQEKIDHASDSAEKNVDKLVSTASKRLAKFPPKTGKVAELLQNKAVKKVDEFGFGVPTAKVFQYISSAVAEGAEQLANKVAVAPKKQPAARKPAPKKVAAKTRTRAKAA